jgi:superfamily I DNA/RNA helicase
LLLTFSKKSAAELRGRIIRRLGPGIEPPECATFHAFALSVLLEHAFELALSPDSTLINDIDARVEFWKAFDELARGTLSTDGSCFALRFGVVDDLCAALYDVHQRLRDQGIAVEDFRRRALAAAVAFAKTPHRSLREPRDKT